MPKGKRKSKLGATLHPKHDLLRVPTSEDDSCVDNASVISNLSELRIGSDDDDTLIDAEDEMIITDDFEDKLKEAIDGTFQKSTKARQTCLETIRKALCSKFMCEFVQSRKVTFSDLVERCLKRGKGEEQSTASAIAALICIHLGTTEENNMIYQSIHPLLIVTLSDPTVLPSVRAQCAASLGICCFISCGGNEIIQATMDSLLSIFSASFLKGNGIMPIHKPEILALHSSALLSWTLLLTLLPPPYIMDIANSHFKKLPQLLDSMDVELRIAAGEAIAVFYELARQCREEFTGDDIDELCSKLRQLATDSQKFRAKKDRRQQRSSFRDVLRAVEECEPPDIRVRFGKEVLYIESWCHKRQYDAFCQLLGAGMSLHLTENELIRDIFELGNPLSFDDQQSPRSSKFERHIEKIAVCKARTISRNKQRDKRADVIR